MVFLEELLLPLLLLLLDEENVEDLSFFAASIASALCLFSLLL